jgi:hypothetical protein
MGLSRMVFLKEFLFVQSQEITIHMEMWKIWLRNNYYIS